jgi:hypothetical protein
MAKSIKDEARFGGHDQLVASMKVIGESLIFFPLFI